MKWLDIVNKSKKMRFYSKNIAANLLPKSLYERQYEKILATLDDCDRDYIFDRVNYYNKLTKPFEPKDSIAIEDFKHKGNSAYVLDFKGLIRYFNRRLKLNYLFGDITHIPDIPVFVKSRPIGDDNQNSLLLNLDSVRHFNFINDPLAFENKKNRACWRGACHGRPHRVKLLEKYYNHPKCNIGDSNKRMRGEKTYKDFMSLSQQLSYKFLLSIEGTDVATNTKWIMSSNSLCFMPKPKFETWFMEGRLIPDYHYVLLDDDYENLEQKIDYYSKHTDEALEIIKNANEYVAQFKNKKRERLIGLLVMKKYFELSGQL
ncbi:MAG: glycosyl transferase family 90 [Francisellaceae bacterium]